MRNYKRRNNTYNERCYEPQENGLAYRFLSRSMAPLFLHPILNILKGLIKTLVHEPNKNKNKVTVNANVFELRILLESL